MLGFCPTVVNKTPMRSLRWGFRNDTSGGSTRFWRSRTLCFMTRLNLPSGEMDSRRYSVMKKYFAIVGRVLAFTVSSFAQQWNLLRKFILNSKACNGLGRFVQRLSGAALGEALNGAQ